MINQAPIVRYTASVSEKFLPNFWRKTFSAESIVVFDPVDPRFKVGCALSLRLHATAPTRKVGDSGNRELR